MEDYNGPIFPPYQCMDFHRCPQYWALKQDGWLPALYGYAEIAGAVGAGMAKAQELFYGEGLPTAHCIERGVAETQAAFTKLRFRGLRCAGFAKATERMAPARVRKYLEFYFDSMPLAGSTIIAVEAPLVGARGRVDLVIQDKLDTVIVDHKHKLTVKKANLVQIYNEYKHSWQLNHYLWFYRTSDGKRATHSEINLGVIEPKPKLIRWRFARDDVALSAWFESAVETWKLMDDIKQGRRVAWQVSNHTAFGAQCPFYGACFQHYYDENLMLNGGYVLNGKKKV